MLTASAASSPKIRPARPADATFLANLRNLLPKHFLSAGRATPEKTVELLGTSRTYVLEVDDKPVGSFALYEENGSMEFGRFMVEPDAQGAGLGRMMLSYAIEEARAGGCAQLRLVTKPENKAALRLYKAAGFQTTLIQMGLKL